MAKRKDPNASEQLAITEATATNEQGTTSITVVSAYKPLKALNFKDKRLTDASHLIVTLGEGATTVNVELARVFGDIKVTKCYEQDGFKSVADFAESVFGIKKQLAYQLAGVGERFYSKDATETAKALAQMYTPSKLAELVNVPEDALTSSVANGTLTGKETQKELREYAKANKPVKVDDKPVVVPQYDFYSNLLNKPTFTGIMEDFRAQWTEPTDFVDAGTATRFEIEDGKTVEVKYKRVLVESTGTDKSVIESKVYYYRKAVKAPAKSEREQEEEVMYRQKVHNIAGIMCNIPRELADKIMADYDEQLVADVWEEINQWDEEPVKE